MQTSTPRVMSSVKLPTATEQFILSTWQYLPSLSDSLIVTPAGKTKPFWLHTFSTARGPNSIGPSIPQTVPPGMNQYMIDTSTYSTQSSVESANQCDIAKQPHSNGAVQPESKPSNRCQRSPLLATRTRAFPTLSTLDMSFDIAQRYFAVLLSFISATKFSEIEHAKTTLTENPVVHDTFTRQRKG